MLRPRITPCLLVHQNGLVKTQRFGSPKYVGDPLNAVRIFNEKEVDEILSLFDRVDQNPILMPVLKRKLDELESLVRETREKRQQRRRR